MSDFTFTEAMITTLTALDDPTLHENDSTGAGSAIYQALISDTTTTIVSEHGIAYVPANNVDPAVWDWLNGAITVNKNTSFFGQFIVEYTLDGLAVRSPNQYLATNQSPSELVAKASNQIAYNVANNIIGSGTFTLPTLSTIENTDAAAVATTVFDTVYGGTGFQNDDIAGWAGTLLAVPGYIDEGLRWLEIQLRRKQHELLELADATVKEGVA